MSSSAIRPDTELLATVCVLAVARRIRRRSSVAQAGAEAFVEAVDHSRRAAAEAFSHRRHPQGR